jgi:glutamate-1-semialdehyde 2,1-aminomutase
MKIKNGINLYNYAKTIIPGGTTLFSKRSELHLPDKWPAYFTKAKKIMFGI